MSHIFICSSQQDSSYTSGLADFLRENGFKVWFEHDPIVPQDNVEWWDITVHGLKSCAAMVVVLSAASYTSEWVQRQLLIALYEKKHVFPLLLDGDIWDVFAVTRYFDVHHRALPPADLLRSLFVCLKPRGRGTNALILALEQRMISQEVQFGREEALADLNRAVQIKDWFAALRIVGQIRAADRETESQALAALEWHIRDEVYSAFYRFERNRQYSDIKSMFSYADLSSIWAALQAFWQRFPGHDPHDLARFQPIPSGAKRSSIQLLPVPFAWIDIPGTLGKTWAGTPYQIAKYPVTNAQYRQFMRAGGYSERRWWTEAGWEACMQGWGWGRIKPEATGIPWTQPGIWRDADVHVADRPVVGISWYEALAYCSWLSDVTGEQISLPTADQWLYAAQGDDGRVYPWGNDWDGRRCKNNVGGRGPAKTCSVRRYESKGDSPFGLVDMVGNAAEWCLDQDTERGWAAQYGGSCGAYYPAAYRCNYFRKVIPYYRYEYMGFRLVRS